VELVYFNIKACYFCIRPLDPLTIIINGKNPHLDIPCRPINSRYSRDRTVSE